jgi:hypothetical protein
MCAATPKIPWIEANQAYLVAEFMRLKSLLNPDPREYSVTDVEKARAGLEIPAAIDRLSELFELSAFERDVLLLCAGVEMDSKLATLCGEAQGHPQRTYATFGLAMAVLPGSHWSALTPVSPLRRFRLVEVETGETLSSACLRIDERILHYLAGINILDPHLQPILRLTPAPVWIADGHKSVATEAAGFIESHSSWTPVINFCGDDPEGQEDVASAAARQLGRVLLVLVAEDLPTVGSEIERFICLWEREAMLSQGTLLIQFRSAEFAASARHLIERLPPILFLASREPISLNRPLLRFDVDKPQPVEQRCLWANACGPSAAHLNGTLDEVS